jgi:hypothetical protein
MPGYIYGKPTLQKPKPPQRHAASPTRTDYSGAVRPHNVIDIDVPGIPKGRVTVNTLIRLGLDLNGNPTAPRGKRQKEAAGIVKENVLNTATPDRTPRSFQHSQTWKELFPAVFENARQAAPPDNSPPKVKVTRRGKTTDEPEATVSVESTPEPPRSVPYPTPAEIFGEVEGETIKETPTGLRLVVRGVRAFGSTATGATSGAQTVAARDHVAEVAQAVATAPEPEAPPLRVQGRNAWIDRFRGVKPDTLENAIPRLIK